MWTREKVLAIERSLRWSAESFFCGFAPIQIEKEIYYPICKWKENKEKKRRLDGGKECFINETRGRNSSGGDSAAFEDVESERNDCLSHTHTRFAWLTNTLLFQSSLRLKNLFFWFVQNSKLCLFTNFWRFFNRQKKTFLFVTKLCNLTFLFPQSSTQLFSNHTKSMLPVVLKSEMKRPSEKQIKQHNRYSTFKHFFFPVAQIVNVNKVYYSKRFLFSSCWWILIHWIVYLRLSFIYIAADVAAASCSFSFTIACLLAYYRQRWIFSRSNLLYGVRRFFVCLENAARLRFIYIKANHFTNIESVSCYRFSWLAPFKNFLV